jgi:hypothetical protein
MQDVPHLSPEDIKEILSSYSPHERDARSKGIPQLGSGAIYPVCEDDITVEPFVIPDKWPRACGMDVGWKKTAAIWGAYDKKSDCWYLYSEYYKGYAEPSVHANAILARGKWIPILIDCHSTAHSQAGAEALIITYGRMGLNLMKADNGPGTLEPGILDMYQRLSSGRMKVMSHLKNWFAEYRVYRRDINGHIVKDQADHLMDSTRFLEKSGTIVMELPPPDDLDDLPTDQPIYKTGQSGICGY